MSRHAGRDMQADERERGLVRGALLPDLAGQVVVGRDRRVRRDVARELQH